MSRLAELMDNDRAQGRMSLTAVAITLVVAGTVGFIGILVMSEVISTAALTSGDPLYNASTGLQDSVDSAWGLFGVAFIVVILSAIVYYLYAVQGGGGGGRV